MFPVSLRVGTEITVVVGTVCAFDDICSHENDSYVYICMPQDILTVALEGDDGSLTVGSNHLLMPHVYSNFLTNFYSYHRPVLCFNNRWYGLYINRVMRGL